MCQNTICQQLSNKTLFCSRSKMLQLQIRLKSIGKCLAGTPTTIKCAWGFHKNQVMGLSSVSLAYDDYNSKTTSSASPILLSHGMLGSRSNWTSIAKQIHKTTGRRVFPAGWSPCNNQLPSLWTEQQLSDQSKNDLSITLDKAKPCSGGQPDLRARVQREHR